jgi:hypothetical protein
MDLWSGRRRDGMDLWSGRRRPHSMTIQMKVQHFILPQNDSFLMMLRGFWLEGLDSETKEKKHYW